MRSQFDIAAFSRSRELVLLAEVKWQKENSEENAISFRKNPLKSGLLPAVPFFLIAYRSGLFLWKETSPPEAKPDYKAAAKPVLKKYLGNFADNEKVPGPESMESAIKLWLSDLANGFESPDSNSEPDKMLVASGLYDRIQNGEVRQHFH